MVFKRRKPLSTLRWVRESFYPSSGWRRAIEYFGHRVKRLPDSPHKIALGFACGVFASFTPLFGLHFFYAAFCAWIVRGNILAACIGTIVGNPITFPFIATVSLGLGRQIMGFQESGEDISSVMEGFGAAFAGLWYSLLSLVGLGEPAWHKLGLFFNQVFLPYYVGGILPGLAAAAVFYALARPAVAAYQARRRSRLLERAKQRLGAKKLAS